MDVPRMTKQHADLELAGLLIVGDAAWELKDRLQRYHSLFERQGASVAAAAARRLIAAIEQDQRAYWQPAVETLRAKLPPRPEAA